MATIKKFEDLEIWKLARELNKFSQQFFDRIHLSNDFKFYSQMTGACGSIMDNIAEGFGRGGNKEFIYFLSISKGSGDEFKSQLYRALDRNFISSDEFEKAYELTSKINSKISAFIEYLNKTSIKGIKFQNTSPPTH